MESQYYRTFIAAPLQVDQSFLKARSRLTEALRGERISWTKPEQYHVTIRFIGDTDPMLIPEIIRALENGVKLPEQTVLRTGSLASFGPLKRPRVIWVGFKGNNFFDPIKRDVDQVLGHCGIALSEQPFRAHLTLGRVRSLQNLKNYMRTLDEMVQEFETAILFEKLVFYRSILGSKGPEYHVLKEIRFPA